MRLPGMFATYREADLEDKRKEFLRKCEPTSVLIIQRLISASVILDSYPESER